MASLDGIQDWLPDWKHEAESLARRYTAPSVQWWHLVIWGAQGCDLDLNLTEIPKLRRPYLQASRITSWYLMLSSS